MVLVGPHSLRVLCLIIATTDKLDYCSSQRGVIRNQYIIRKVVYNLPFISNLSCTAGRAKLRELSGGITDDQRQGNG